MAQTIGEAVIEVGADMDGFSRDVNGRLRDERGRFVGEGRRAGSGFGLAAGAGMASGIGRAVPAIGGALAAIGIGGFVKDSIQEASDLGESLNALAVTYGDNASQIEALGATSAESFGLSQTELNNFAVRFSAFSKQLAGEGQNSADVFESIAGRATDFASVMNLEVSDAAQIFQSGLAGETEPLRQFGIDLSAAAVEAFAVSEGIADAGSTMSEQQKVQARYGLLMQQTAETAGDFANTSDGLANQQRILGAQFDTLRATLGNALLPVITGFVSFLNSAMGPAIEFIGGLFDQTGEKTTGLGTTFQGFLTAVQPILDVFRQIGQQFVSVVVPAFQSLWDVIVNQVWPSLQGFFEAIMPLVTRLAEILGVILVGAFRLVADTVKNLLTVFSGLLDFISGVFTGDWEKAWGGIEKIFGAVIDQVVAVGRFLWNTLGKLFGQGVKAVQTLWQHAWNRVTDVFSNFRSRVGGVVSGLWSNIRSTFSGGLSRITGWVRDRLGSIRDTFSNIGGALRRIMSNAWNILVRNVRNSIGNLISNVREIPGRIRSALGNLGSLLYSAGQNVISGLIDGIRSMIYSVGSAMGSIAGTIRSYLPFSPAKEGPLSGSGNPEHSGEVIAQMLSDGLRSGANDVALAMGNALRPFSAGTVGSRVSPVQTSPAANRQVAANPTPTSIGGPTVNQNFYGPTTSGGRLQEMNWTLRYATQGTSERNAGRAV